MSDELPAPNEAPAAGTFSIYYAVAEVLAQLHAEIPGFEAALRTDVSKHIMIPGDHGEVKAVVHSLFEAIRKYGQAPYVARIMFIAGGIEMHVEGTGFTGGFRYNKTLPHWGGLELAQRIVDRHGGQLFGGESYQGGPSFRFNLPRHRP